MISPSLPPRGKKQDPIRSYLLKIAWAACLGLSLTGCRPTPVSSTDDAKEPAKPLVLHALNTGFRLVPIFLATDYGFLISNIGNEDHPKAQISVGLRQEKRVIHCCTLSEFETALQTLPKGVTLYRHQRCLVPAGYGLDEAFLFGMEATLDNASKNGLTLATDPVVTCLCGK